MALIFCSECGNKISEDAKTCPQCGNSKQVKSGNARWLSIILVSTILISGVFLSWESLFSEQEGNDEWLEKITVSQKILNDNKDDLIEVLTKKIKQRGVKIGLEMLFDNRMDCMIDTLSTKLAEKHSLQELRTLQTRSFSLLSEFSKLVEENHKVCWDCITFKQ